MPRYGDLREWLEIVEDMGELRHLRGAHWDLELAAINDMVSKERGFKPALLFDDIVDHAPGYRLLTNSMSSMGRLALTTGLPAGTDDLAFVRMWNARVKASSPLPPKTVGTGPVLEHVFDGDDVDMRKFPAPRWHPGDGGRYIGTAPMVITRDPDDDGDINVGCYRVMVYDERRMGALISPYRGGAHHRRRWFDRGEPCPVVVSFGHDPLLLVAAAEQLPAGQSELDWVGGVRGSSVEVLTGQVTGLPVPAAAEIVVEGYFLPDEVRPEGPFGEFTGYYASGERPEPVLRVDRLMHRSDPVLLAASRGRPPDDPTFWQTRMKASSIWAGLDGAGVPGVRAVWCHNPNSNLFTVVSIEQRYAGHARQAGLVAQQCAGGLGMGRWVIVVDDDIDPANIDDVLWALATRADPERAIQITRFSTTSSLDTASRPGDKTHASRCVIEACRPWEWREEFPAVADVDPEVAARVRAQWRERVWP